MQRHRSSTLRLLKLSISLACLWLATRAFADDPKASTENLFESSIPAAQVKNDAVVFHLEAAEPKTITGFYIRLTNCVGPRQEPTVVGIRCNGKLLEEKASIPVYGVPLNMYTRSGGDGRIFPPLDVGQEYRTALAKPIELKSGDVVNLYIVSTEPLTSGITAGLQLAGTWPLAEMREPFRVTKSAGPVCRVPWSARVVVCTGSQKKDDPLCAPQNNSGVVSDADGSLYQFTSYYSLDEQYGGGRAGSYARIFGYKKALGSGEWQPLGLIADPVPMQLTYCGDPFAFRDLDGRPCLLYTVADGTNGFLDWTHIGAQLRISRTDSFAGPWSEPHPIFDGLFPRSEVSRPICLRIYPRAKTGDYLVAWAHGEEDIRHAAAIIPNLDTPLTQQQVQSAPTLTRNQEEGGGGFVRGDKGYLSTWQIPSINDVTAIQRLYEFDLYDPLNPEKWTVVPGSWGWNDGTNPVEDGGETADSWSLSYLPETDTLWASSVVWSASREKNSILACRVPWKQRSGDIFQFGCPKTFANEVAPVVEYAVGDHCSLVATVTAEGEDSAIFLFLAPSQRPQSYGGFAVELSSKGIRLVAYYDTGSPDGLTSYIDHPFVPGKPHRIKMQRSGLTITGWVDGRQVGPVTITNPAQQSLLDEQQCFKFYGWQGCRYTVQDAVLTDGFEKQPIPATP